jgi:morphogenetic protein associated with SpoVID
MRQVKIYTVKKGDTLSGIAAKHGVTVQDLLQYNPGIRDPDVIDVGMKIKIPAPKASAPAGDWVHQHKVVQGDTLWKLSKAWGVPLADLIKANPHLKNPNVLMTGEIVNIPKPGWQAGGGESGGQAAGSGYPQELQHIGVEQPVKGKKFTGTIPGKTPTAPVEQPQPIDLAKLELPPAPKMEMPKKIEQPIAEEKPKVEEEKPKVEMKPADWTKLPKPVPLPVPEPIHQPVKPYCPEPQYPAYPVHHDVYPPHAAVMPDMAKHPFQQFSLPAIEAFAPGAAAGAGYPPVGAGYPPVGAGQQAPDCGAGYGAHDPGIAGAGPRWTLPGAPWDPIWSGHGYEWPVQAGVQGMPGWPGLSAYASVGAPYPGWPAPYPPGAGVQPFADYRGADASDGAGGDGGDGVGGADRPDKGAARISAAEEDGRAAAKPAGRGSRAKKATVRIAAARGSRRLKQQATKKRSGQPWINGR